ncbi:MAG: energy transducer TonB [Synergistaceae bacterium]|jgi:protein TonB|nr:energy transducer TonB [Synergistaceae bacterium]
MFPEAGSKIESARWAAALLFSVAVHTAILGILPGEREAADIASSPVVTVTLRRMAEPQAPAEAETKTKAKTEDSKDSQKFSEAKNLEKIPEVTRPVPPSKPQKKRKTAPEKSPAKRPEPPASEKRPELASMPSSSAITTSTASSTSAAASASAAASTSARSSSSAILDISSLRVLNRVRPDYPAIARRRGDEGTVTLLITLEGSSVSGVSVEKSSGSPVLDQAAVSAVRKWKFENAGRTRARVPVTFRLNR